MNETSHWQARVDAVWANDSLNNAEVIDAIDALVSERPDGDARALFEAAGARDSAGLEAQAEPLYRRALHAGLPESQRAQATIQLASTIRNLGRIDEAIELLRGELNAQPQGEYSTSAAAFLALALAEQGEALEAAQIALLALASTLPRYARSVAGYANALTQSDSL